MIIPSTTTTESLDQTHVHKGKDSSSDVKIHAEGEGRESLFMVNPLHMIQKSSRKLNLVKKEMVTTICI